MKMFGSPIETLIVIVVIAIFMFGGLAVIPAKTQMNLPSTTYYER